MKQALHEKRLEKINALKEEVMVWQQVVVKQEQRIQRLELNFSALMATLAQQKRFSRGFDHKRMAAELDRMIHAQYEAVNKNGDAAGNPA